MNEQDKIIVACHGASITRGLGSFNWIKDLQKRPENARYKLLNFGVGGDPAYNGVKRLPKVIAANPQKVILAFGWNDIMLAVFDNVLKFMGGAKNLPEAPTPENFRRNLITMVDKLRAAGTHDIAIMSLSEVGENPESINPVQTELNRRFAEYSAIIKEVASSEKLYYIPLYEEMHRAILDSKNRKDFTAFRFRSFYWDTIREFIFGQSLDKVATQNGWMFHVDGIHLSSKGGLLLAKLVQDYLDQPVSKIASK